MADILGLGVLVLAGIVMFALDTEPVRWWCARRQARRATRRIWRQQGRRPRDPAVVRAERDRQTPGAGTPRADPTPDDDD